MRVRLDSQRRESLLSQARDQVIAALHAGLIRHGQRLPSLRSVARLSKLNVKTVMKVYAQLQREGVLEIRGGSGAFLTDHEPGELEPAQALLVGRLLRRHLDEAAAMNLSPETYVELSRALVTRAAMKKGAVAVLECNPEQVHLYCWEITRRIGVVTRPVLLGEWRGREAAAILRASSIFAITDFHPREGAEISREYGRPLVRLRMRRDFIPALMNACRRGHLAMIVSDISFFPAFRRALGDLGLDATCLDRIHVAAGTDPGGVRRAVARADLPRADGKLVVPGRSSGGD